MRLRSKLAIGGGAVSAVTAGALVVGGVFATSATLVAVDPGAAPAQADGLATFADCGELRDWYVENNLSEVGAFGWGDGRVYTMKGLLGGNVRTQSGMLRRSPSALGDLDTATSSRDERASSSTGTNTQEIDVDEPDVAKTDGKLLVRLTRPRKNFTDQMLAVSDVTGAAKYTLGRLHLPQISDDSQLLLVGEHAIVTQSVGGYGGPIANRGIYTPAAPGTRVLDVDVSDPTHPHVVRTDVYSGSLLSARQYGDTVRLVTDTGRPELKWWTPGENKVSAAIAKAHNKQLVEKSTIEDWLPAVRSDGTKERLLDCTDVMRPSVWSGSDTIAVSTYEPGTTGRSTVGITASGGLVYSSADRLYVASTQWQRRGPEPLDSRPGPSERVIAPGDGTTDLHAFKLTGTGTTYVGSGPIQGSVRDRWSLDEYDGNLRVAWSGNKGGLKNGVSVLTERGHRLVELGRLGDIGVGEDIQSVRWFDHLAVVVTFRQMDPLHTIDLSDPAHPRQLGELRVPGYSGYLHPIGDDLLLGLGAGNGAQAAVFDIHDLEHPKQVSRKGFGFSSYLQALDEPRTFTWLPGKRTGLTPVADWHWGRGDGLRVVALHVDEDGALTTSTIAHLTEGWQPRILPLDDDRVAIVDGDRVQLIGL